MDAHGLRELEHLVMLAISRLDAPVHAVPVVRELRQVIKRSVDRASVYVVLRRLEAKGLVTSEMGDATPQRGGRAKRLYSLTPLAVQTLRAAREDFVNLWAGSRVFAFVCVFVLSVSGALSASANHQAGTSGRPDLSGLWLNQSDPNATDTTVAANLPNALLTIDHKGDTFTLTRSWSNGPIHERHVCDGRENKNGYSIVVERTKCRWEPARGGTLIIAGTIGREDGTVVGTLEQRYWIDGQGLLNVERSRVVDRLATGASPSTPQAGRPLTQQYRKVARPATGLQ